MVKKTILQQLDGTGIIDSTAEVVFEQLLDGTRKAKLSAIASGLSVVYVHTLDDLPPLIGGFRTLEQNKVYQINAPITLADDLLIPAGWNGIIRSSHTPVNAITYTGSGSLLNTLNIDGTILSIADSTESPGVKSTITTSAPHGLSNGQFANITGTTNYSQSRLLLSNVTASTFDVEIPFTITETGLFDTGFLGLLLFKAAFFNDVTGNLFNVTAMPDPTATFTYDGLTAIGFISLGTIRNATNVVGALALTAFFVDGLILENCDTIGLIQTSLSVIATAIPSATCIIITGSATRDIALFQCKFNVATAAHFPVRIDGSVNNADLIIIEQCPDNNIATDYFDTSAGGLDQTNPQVTAKNNGFRANSMSSAQVGFTNIATPIVVTIDTESVPVIIGGTQFISNGLERATATTGGQITNLTKPTRKYPITFSALIEKVGGGSTDIGLLLIKNGSLVLTNTFEIPHSVNPGVIQISATRDFELEENDTLDIAVVNFSGTSNISVSQANIVYTVEA